MAAGRVAILLAWMLTLVVPVYAGSSDPSRMLQELTDQVIAAIRRDPQRLQDVSQVRLLVEQLVLPHVDFRAAGQWVLGKHWRSASEQQRDRFVAEFRALLLQTYLHSVRNYSEQEITIHPARLQQQDRAEVDAEVAQGNGGPPIHVSFRLHRVQDDWLIYDIVVEGISLVTTHRSAFSREISEQGLDSLIARLARMNTAESPSRVAGQSAAAAGH